MLTRHDRYPSDNVIFTISQLKLMSDAVILSYVNVSLMLGGGTIYGWL